MFELSNMSRSRFACVRSSACRPDGAARIGRKGPGISPDPLVPWFGTLRG
jgi:hypothetical protein